MQAEKLLKMDPYIALSWMNTKLRNDFDSLDALCQEINIDLHQLIEKMARVDYTYNHKTNQWISIN